MTFFERGSNAEDFKGHRGKMNGGKIRKTVHCTSKVCDKRWITDKPHQEKSPDKSSCSTHTREPTNQSINKPSDIE